MLNNGSTAGTAGVLTAFEDDSYGNRVASNTATASDPYTGFGAEWGYRTDSSTGLELLGTDTMTRRMGGLLIETRLGI